MSEHRDTQIFPLTNGRFVLAFSEGSRTQTVDLDRRSLTILARQVAGWSDEGPKFCAALADPEE